MTARTKTRLCRNRLLLDRSSHMKMRVGAERLEQCSITGIHHLFSPTEANDVIGIVIRTSSFADIRQKSIF